MKKKGQRFTIEYTNTPEFLKRINEIVEGNEDTTLTIPCTKEEFEQFDL